MREKRVDVRRFYETEANENNWSSRELARQTGCAAKRKPEQWHNISLLKRNGSRCGSHTLSNDLI